MKVFCSIENCNSVDRRYLLPACLSVCLSFVEKQIEKTIKILCLKSGHLSWPMNSFAMLVTRILDLNNGVFVSCVRILVVLNVCRKFRRNPNRNYAALSIVNTFGFVLAWNVFLFCLERPLRHTALDPDCLFINDNEQKTVANELTRSHKSTLTDTKRAAANWCDYERTKESQNNYELNKRTSHHKQRQKKSIHSHRMMK